MKKQSRKSKTHYTPYLQPYARKLRNNGTKAEACLWKYALRAKQMKGYGFRRQRPILNYIADFACLPLHLIIEVDGSIHDREDIIAKDIKKTQDLEAVGFTVLRFTNEEVLKNMNQVIQTIGMTIEKLERNTPDFLEETIVPYHSTPLGVE